MIKKTDCHFAKNLPDLIFLKKMHPVPHNSFKDENIFFKDIFIPWNDRHIPGENAVCPPDHLRRHPVHARQTSLCWIFFGWLPSFRPGVR